MALVSLILTGLTPGQLAGWGWRVAFLIAAPIGLVGLYVRTRLFGSTAPLVTTWLSAVTHSPLAPGFYLLPPGSPVPWQPQSGCGVETSRPGPATAIAR